MWIPRLKEHQRMSKIEEKKKWTLKISRIVPVSLKNEDQNIPGQNWKNLDSYENSSRLVLDKRQANTLQCASGMKLADSPNMF